MRINKRNLLYTLGGLVIVTGYFLEGLFGIRGNWQLLTFLVGGALVFWGFASPPLDEEANG